MSISIKKNKPHVIPNQSLWKRTMCFTLSFLCGTENQKCSSSFVIKRSICDLKKQVKFFLCKTSPVWIIASQPVVLFSVDVFSFENESLLHFPYHHDWVIAASPLILPSYLNSSAHMPFLISVSSPISLRYHPLCVTFTSPCSHIFLLFSSWHRFALIHSCRKRDALLFCWHSMSK